MNAGHFFRIKNVADIHYWTIISDPTIELARILIVNFTTWDPYEDQACVLQGGEHPRLPNKTCVNYGRARVTDSNSLEKLKAANRLEFFEPLSPALLKLIRERALESTRIKIELAQILLDQELVE
jgi:hypothetical protein